MNKYVVIVTHQNGKQQVCCDGRLELEKNEYGDYKEIFTIKEARNVSKWLASGHPTYEYSIYKLVPYE
jgi:hypothetical protein